nr:hypothetical protein [Paenibacillus fonticola]
MKELFAETHQEMLKAELDTHLGYEKHEITAKMTPKPKWQEQEDGGQ